MKILSIIGYSMMGLCFGSLVALMQFTMFYMMFVSSENSTMPMPLRIIMFILTLTISAGWSIQLILKEVKEHNLIKAFKEIK